MAQPQLTLTPFSGVDKKNSANLNSHFEVSCAVAAHTAYQQAHFRQLHLRDAA